MDLVRTWWFVPALAVWTLFIVAELLFSGGGVSSLLQHIGPNGPEGPPMTPSRFELLPPPWSQLVAWIIGSAVILAIAWRTRRHPA